jgi:hypothetical protein
VCNLYSMTKNVDAIRRLFGALNSHVGNLPSMPGIFPDYPAPIVRNAPNGREGRSFSVALALFRVCSINYTCATKFFGRSPRAGDSSVGVTAARCFLPELGLR